MRSTLDVVVGIVTPVACLGFLVRFLGVPSPRTRMMLGRPEKLSGFSQALRLANLMLQRPSLLFY